MSVNLTALDCDYYVCSGHKLGAPFGVGLLYCKQPLPPMVYGGGMVERVTAEKTTFLPTLEAGTPNVSGAVGLAAALEYRMQLPSGWQTHEAALLRHAETRLREIPGIHFLGSGTRVGCLSFTVEGVDAFDLAAALDQLGIMLRSGARTSLELNHAGHFAIPAFNDGHTPPMSATARKMPNGNLVREMTEEDMDYVADIYANAIHMAWRGGFDMACLHYGHGWLFGGWMSPLLNQRTDRHGGSLENRVRFPRMVLERIRKKVGDNILLELRLSGSELTPGGLEIEDTIEIIKMMEDLVDLVHISSGTRWNASTRGDMHPTCFVDPGHTAPMAQKVKEAGIKIPVGCVGGVNTPELAEKILSEGMADYVLMARPWVADPEWANKVRSGHPPGRPWPAPARYSGQSPAPPGSGYSGRNSAVQCQNRLP